jgi:hypothetical protein
VIQGDWNSFRQYGGATLQITFGIAVGLIFVVGTLHILSSFTKRKRNFKKRIAFSFFLCYNISVNISGH